MSKLKGIKLKKEEKAITYSNRILELVSELQSANHEMSKVEMNRALLRGLAKEFDITAESIIGAVMS